MHEGFSEITDNEQGALGEQAFLISLIEYILSPCLIVNIREEAGDLEL